MTARKGSRKKLQCGQYKNRTFGWIFKTDKAYCLWVQKLQTPGSALLPLYNWLKANHKTDDRPSQSDQRKETTQRPVGSVITDSDFERDEGSDTSSGSTERDSSPDDDNEEEEEQEDEEQRRPARKRQKRSVVPDEWTEEPAEKTSEEKACCICLTRAVRAICLPCGHLCVCVACSRQLSDTAAEDFKCPMCRAALQSIVRAFQ